MASTTYDPVGYAFDTAKKEFQAQLKDPDLYGKILKTATIDEVYDFTDKLQEEQAKTGRLRHLAKIEPYLEQLRGYAKVIEVFTQANAEILCLIWGPIKLLLEWSSNLKKSFDEIILVTAAIGDNLPQFEEMARIFSSSDSLKNLLILFFKDILDFYQICFEFFTKKRWQYIVEAVWPKYKAKIEIVVKHIQRHLMLMKDEVTLQRIRDEYDARKMAFDHYENETRFRLRRDFDSNQAKIAPKMYYDKLNHLRETACRKTGEWLTNYPTFIKWIDMGNASTKVIWLEGIPGSGKTYLSATVVDKFPNMIYAFLTHIHSSISAISILHTLIFQLAEGNDDVKAVVNTSNLKDLQGSTDYAVKILANALKTQGPTYVVIDGLDEIGELDRQVLLFRLCAIVADEPEVKILVSSRNDHLINRILRPQAQIIDIDDKNESCIQTYIQMRTSQWFQEAQFDLAAESEIKKLLKPLAKKANGMFLYARIVLDNVEMLYDVEAIEKDLRALPKDLNEAQVLLVIGYGRIFARIKDLPLSACEQATKLLGWVGCSEESLTIQELEQAILIAPGKGAPRVTGSLPVLKLCGPIIEVIDDKVQFVHFTVKEYIFCKDIPGFIDLGDTAASLLVACLEHLSSRIFDDDRADEEIQEDIVHGLYRFSNFAISQWLKLIMQHASNNNGEPAANNLAKSVEEFLEARRNPNFTNEEVDIPTKLSLTSLKKTWSDSYELLSCVLAFHSQSQHEEWRLNEIDNWQHNDPLTILSTTAKIREQYEEVLCINGHHTKCNCHLLTRHYGKNLFRCDFLFCPSYFHGFPTNETLKRHVEHHERRYKCPDKNCEFFTLGFTTESARDNHVRNHNEQGEIRSGDSTKLTSTASEATLFDMVRAGDAANVSFTITKITRLSRDVHMELLKLAIASGAIDVVETLMGGSISAMGSGLFLLEHGFKTNNIDFLKWLSIDKAKDLPQFSGRNRPIAHYLGGPLPMVSGSWKEVNTAVIMSDSSDAFNLWAETLVARTPLLAFTPLASIDTSEYPEQEARLLTLWKTLVANSSVKEKNLNRALIEVAKGCCSVIKGKTLLELGADVNFKNKGPNAPRLLQYALRNTTRKGAEFAKLLLLEGADSEISCRNVHARDERGAKGISKWLGMSFDEIVEWAKAERSKHNII